MLPVYKTRVGQKLEEIKSRQDLRQAQRIVIKAGTSIVVNDDGYPHLRQIANLAEEIAQLRREGRDVILVQSGAVGVGRNVIARQEVMMTSANEQLQQAAVRRSKGATHVPVGGVACVGQTQLSSLYYNLFGQLDIITSDILLSKFDFETAHRTDNLTCTIETCLAHGVLPIINENDAVTCSYNKSPEDVFNDNDGLAALVASQMRADLLVILTDVDGVYDRPPTEDGARVLSVFGTSNTIEFGGKSSMGRGGMEAKVSAAKRAIDRGLPCVVIINGKKNNMVSKVINGENTGTMFVPNPDVVAASENNSREGDVRAQAQWAKTGSLALSKLSGADRSQALLDIATALEEEQDAILAANKKDMELASINRVAPALQKRLELTPKKLATLSEGIRTLAKSDDPIGRETHRMEVSDNTFLTKVTTPIGVLLIIFESRPDSLPQIAALSIRSGNGLLLKGGREAKFSNEKLHSIITKTLQKSTKGRVPASTIGLVTTRDEISSLLKLDKYIDLVIPRGSKALVQNIQNNTKIPVMGHADGVCHLYVHSAADVEKAKNIVVDAKINYPAACNAVETVLIDSSLVATKEGQTTSPAQAIVAALRDAGVTVYGSRQALAHGLGTVEVEDFHTEYGDLRVAVEIVNKPELAIEHINKFGSHHTDGIITENQAVADNFIACVDSACVFHNASTRMADGFRFGLGAEVGISTSRIHARGPVGVQGLMTEKWVLVDQNTKGPGTTAGAFEKGDTKFIHRVCEIQTPSN